MKVLVALCLIGLPGAVAAATNLVVATDGSGQFKTVPEAIMAVPSGTAENPVLIHIKPGTYRELLYIQRENALCRVPQHRPRHQSCRPGQICQTVNRR